MNVWLPNGRMATIPLPYGYHATIWLPSDHVVTKQPYGYQDIMWLPNHSNIGSSAYPHGEVAIFHPHNGATALSQRKIQRALDVASIESCHLGNSKQHRSCKEAQHQLNARPVYTALLKWQQNNVHIHVVILTTIQGNNTTRK